LSPSSSISPISMRYPRILTCSFRHLELHPGELGADAVVRAVPERQV
jgi:hypothetical protein